MDNREKENLTLLGNQQTNILIIMLRKYLKHLKTNIRKTTILLSLIVRNLQAYALLQVSRILQRSTFPTFRM